MNFAFLILRLNSLSYFIPLVKYLRSLGHKIFFEISPKKDNKYNSIHYGNNYFIAEKILEENGFNNCLERESFEKLCSLQYIDYLFSIEGAGFEPLKKNILPYKHIIIQNYHDYSFSAQYHTTEQIYKECFGMWLNEDFHTKLLKYDLHFQGETITSLLPNYWHYKNQTREELLKKYNINLDGKKLAICFLPRPKEIITESWKDVKYTPSNEIIKTGEPSKYLKHALNFADFLQKKNYLVILKQRQKDRNETLKHLPNYIEDNEQWFSSMPLDLTFMSDLCYGYRSSSVLDAKTFGRKYIDFYKSDFSPITENIFKYYNMSVHMNTKFEDIDIENCEENNFNENVENSLWRVKNYFNKE